MRELVNVLRKVLNTFRFTVDGVEVRSTEIFQTLSSDPDRERRRHVHDSLAQVNGPLVEAGFVRLIALRNAFAREVGFPDFVAYKLDQQELGSGFCDGWPKGVRAVRASWVSATR